MPFDKHLRTPASSVLLRCWYLLLQCFPMAYLVEQAGGLASTGTQRILDIIPTQIHER